MLPALEPVLLVGALVQSEVVVPRDYYFVLVGVENLVKSPEWMKMSAGGRDFTSIRKCRSWVSDIATTLSLRF